MKVYIVKSYETYEEAWPIKVFKSETRAEEFRKSCEEELNKVEKQYLGYLIQECEADLNE